MNPTFYIDDFGLPLYLGVVNFINTKTVIDLNLDWKMVIEEINLGEIVPNQYWFSLEYNTFFRDTIVYSSSILVKLDIMYPLNFIPTPNFFPHNDILTNLGIENSQTPPTDVEMTNTPTDMGIIERSSGSSSSEETESIMISPLGHIPNDLLENNYLEETNFMDLLIDPYSEISPYSQFNSITRSLFPETSGYLNTP